MYGFECAKKLLRGACPDRRCLYPAVCESLRPDHGRQIALLRKLRRIPGRQAGRRRLRHPVRPGPRRPETRHRLPPRGRPPSHLRADEDRPRALGGTGPGLHGETGPGGPPRLSATSSARLTAEAGKEQFLTYYLIAAHPGCTQADMEALHRFAAGSWRSTPNRSSSSPRPPPRSPR